MVNLKSIIENNNDYEIIEKPDGYYISKFTGFEEDEMIVPNVVKGKNIIGITECAFLGCKVLKKITVSEGIKVIESAAFRSSSLEKVLLPSTLERIGSEATSSRASMGAFSQTSLKEISIPESVTFIGQHSFYACMQLEKVHLPNNLTSIEPETFAQCKNLEYINLPKELLDIKHHAFYKCVNLCKIDLPSKLVKIEEYAFSYCGFEEIHIPNGTKSIGFFAFDKTPLNSIYIPPSVIDFCKNHKLGFTNLGQTSNDMIIYCAAGSTAMDYARTKSIKCKKAEF